MPEINLSVLVEEAHIKVEGPLALTVELRGVEVADLVAEVGENLLLEQIGREKALTYFGAADKE